MLTIFHPSIIEECKANMDNSDYGNHLHKGVYLTSENRE